MPEQITMGFARQKLPMEREDNPEQRGGRQEEAMKNHHGAEQTDPSAGRSDGSGLWAFRCTPFALAVPCTAGPKGFEPFLLGLTACPPAVPIAAQRKWDVKAAAAAADLIESLGDDQIAHIKDIRTDPHGMWQRLELFHTSGRAANDKLSTWKQFFSIQYTDYLVELKDHIGGLIEITGRLADFEAPLELSPSMVIARIISSLPRPEFSDIIKRLDTDSRNAERDYVIGRLLKEEEHPMITDNSRLSLSFTREKLTSSGTREYKYSVPMGTSEYKWSILGFSGPQVLVSKYLSK
ncbi:hypothetical protein C8J56DRAFT_1084980 [Mycena floridula]|nr:hypothetical protein C8J56DRAFT_1084980 [Mycena floridula]